jgi:hypothetical protein
VLVELGHSVTKLVRREVTVVVGAAVVIGAAVGVDGLGVEELESLDQPRPGEEVAPMGETRVVLGDKELAAVHPPVGRV